MSILGKKEEAKPVIQGGPPTPEKMARRFPISPPSCLGAAGRLWGGKEYPSDSRSGDLQQLAPSTGSVTAGRTGAVPKTVLEQTLIPNRQAKLYEAPAKKAAFKRPTTDVGGFRRR
jgi:hypothetical protein